MRIAIFTDTFPPQTNGVANHVFNLGKKLASIGHNIIFFAPSGNTKNYLNLDLPNLKVVSLPSLPALVYTGERIVLPFGKTLKILKKFQPNIIHAHTPFGAGYLALRSAKKLKIPLIGTHHTFFDHYLKYIGLDFNWAKKLSWRYTINFYNKFDCIISPSNALAEILKSAGLKKPIELVNNFVDTDSFKPANNYQIKLELKKQFGITGQSIAYMGRLSYEKSVDKIIKMFNIVQKNTPNLKLMIIGDGPTRKELEEQVKKLNLNDNIVFTGFLYQQNLVNALLANDVFITASKSENMPLALLEAMAAGLPIVAVREKGVGEILKNNYNGFFAKTDNEFDMAEKILLILNDQTKLERFSQNSRKLAMVYSKDATIKSFENVYLNYFKR